MSADGRLFRGNANKSIDKTFRSDYLKSSDFGNVSSFSAHLNKSKSRCRFTDNEFSRRQNYWGRGMPERQDLFFHEKKSRQPKFDKGTSIIGSYPRKNDGSVFNKKKFRSEFLNDTIDLLEKEQKSCGDVFSNKEKHFIDAYINKPAPKKNDWLISSPSSPSKELRQNACESKLDWNDSSDLKINTTSDPWQKGKKDSLDWRQYAYKSEPLPNTSRDLKTFASNDIWREKKRDDLEWKQYLNKSKPIPNNSCGDLKTITARDLWQEGKKDNLEESLNSSKRKGICRPRSFSPRSNRRRARRRRRRSRGSISRSPNNMSQNAMGKVCFCMCCRLPRSSSCPRPRRQRTRSPPMRFSIDAGKSLGVVAENQELVVCFSSSWSESQLAVLKPFLKTTTCSEVVKILALVRTLIKERYSSPCPNPWKSNKNACQQCQCPMNKPSTEMYRNKPFSQCSRRTPSPSFKDYCKDYERHCKAEETRNGSKTRRAKRRLCKKSPRSRQPVKEECPKKTGKDVTKLNVVIPSVSECSADDDKQSEPCNKQHSPKLPTICGRSISLDRKNVKKDDWVNMGNDSVTKTVPNKSAYQPVRSWTDVIKDCKKFLKCTQNLRCQGKSELESKLIDCKTPDFATINNNKLDEDTITLYRPLSDEEPEECSSDDIHSLICDFNTSHSQRFDTYSNAIPFMARPCSPDRQNPPGSYKLSSSDTSSKCYNERKKALTKSKNRKGERHVSKTIRDSASSGKDIGKMRKRVSNSQNPILDNHAEDRNIDPATLLNINKNTQMLLNKASERIKQVESYLDRNDNVNLNSKSTEKQKKKTLNYGCMLTNSEVNFQSETKNANLNGSNQSNKTQSENFSNLKQFAQEENSYQDLKLSSNNIADCFRDGLEGNLRKHGGVSEKSSVEGKARGISDASTSNCSSLTSLDTALTSSNVSAMRRSYKRLSKGSNNTDDGKASDEINNPCADDYETDTTPRSRGKANTSDSSLNDSYQKFPSNFCTKNGCPVVVKCYETTSPMPKRMQSWC